MAYDVEQQESISAFKAWFERYGNGIMGAAIVVLAAVAANSGWRWYQGRESAAAAAVFEQYEQAVSGKDLNKAKELAGALVQQHGSSAYAGLAALTQARLSLEAGDAAAAKAQLQWVIDHSGEREFAALARVRLAGVLLDEKAYDQGLALLQADAPVAMAAQFSDRRGDLLLAQGKAADARAAYAKALEQAGAQDPLRALIQSKLDGLPAAG
jgi:predicted negative regulator of RcsB-dependent stress response